jgi:hypothetical protein
VLRTIRTKIIIKILLFLISPISSTIFAATASKSLAETPSAIMVYWGKMTANELLDDMALHFTITDETLYSIEFSQQLSKNNIIRRFFQPLLTTVEMVGNFTYRDDPVGPIYEINPYLAFRWANFPWNKYIVTSFAVGEGLSYDSKVPKQEIPEEGNPQRVLNYLMLELTLALPRSPQWELVARIHHRSGIFGLYESANGGSTAVGLGLRYRF